MRSIKHVIAQKKGKWVPKEPLQREEAFAMALQSTSMTTTTSGNTTQEVPHKQVSGTIPIDNAHRLAYIPISFNRDEKIAEQWLFFKWIMVIFCYFLIFFAIFCSKINNKRKDGQK